MPFLLAIPLILAVGALAFKTVTDESQQTIAKVSSAAPSLALVAIGIGTAFVLWRQFSRKN